MFVATHLFCPQTPATALTLAEESASKARWISVPIIVTGLPATVECVPVSCSIDFGALSKKLGLPGVVDQQLLRLFRTTPDGNEQEVSFQFTPNRQERKKEKALLPGTPKEVSYLHEFKAGDSAAGTNQTGTLSWLVHNRLSRVASHQYLLLFAIPEGGRFVQVPYPPHNYVAFDSENRGTRQPWFPQMQIRPQQPLDGKVNIIAADQLFASYHVGPLVSELGRPIQFRRPFLYPLHGPGGGSYTEFGKPHDPTGSHGHHYSFWIAHADVGGRDFWSERGGLIEHDRFEELQDGPVFCRVLHRTRWTWKNQPVLSERRQLTFYATPEQFQLFDVELELSGAGEEAVVLGKTSFGFLATRVAQSMSPFDGGGEIINSEGQRNEQSAHLNRAAWLDQSGPVRAGQWGGIAIFDHPGNPRHPTAWHCRNDGWAGASFNANEPFTLEPGQTLRLRYRIHLHQHDSVRGEVAARYLEYIAEPAVDLGEPKERVPAADPADAN